MQALHLPKLMLCPKSGTEHLNVLWQVSVFESLNVVSFDGGHFTVIQVGFLLRHVTKQ